MEIKKETVQNYLYPILRDQWRILFGTEIEIQLHKWLIKYKSNCLFLYNVHGLLTGDSYDILKDEQQKLVYKKTASTLDIIDELSTLHIPIAIAKQAIQMFCDYLYDYLPLGSVVILNKKYLGKAFDVDDIQEVRFVITQRFATVPDTETFYPYGGVLYPIGHIEGERVLYFTPPLIEKVQFVGFQDVTDYAYLVEMREELLKKRAYQSIAFIDPDKREQAQKVIERIGR
ncbi:DUF4176 domain-containing protein [Listeria monocytogenes]|uniref:DUF4176 domain-containing protein n=1 Tax=Listeria monocytogenes TaxID=1639 RepID=UPI0010F33A2A|nr:DUF4176 domain-containing protein [Listeria monocytogenes]EAD2655566.1 DUF4176 domain-containing protein [Listeria monocytogenes]TYU88643.1 DUF4176 domain-containing protein [Listeria monocytogenes]